jgi:hypothetical protein
MNPVAETLKDAITRPVERKVCGDLMNGHVIVVGRWLDARSTQVSFQEFNRNGESFLPIFSDESHFREEIKGSGFEGDGISIDCKLFVSLLRGDEVLILNPGSPHPMRLRKADFE